MSYDQISNLFWYAEMRNYWYELTLFSKVGQCPFIAVLSKESIHRYSISIDTIIAKKMWQIDPCVVPPLGSPKNFLPETLMTIPLVYLTPKH